MTRDEVLHLAALAGLSLDPSEEAKIVADLGRIVAYLGELAQIDTAGVEPLESPGESAAPLRADVERAPAPGFLEAALAAAPATDGGAFVVPGFLD